MERYLKFREEYSRFFYRGYDVEETLNELKITYTFEIRRSFCFYTYLDISKKWKSRSKMDGRSSYGKNDSFPWEW